MKKEGRQTRREKEHWQALPKCYTATKMKVEKPVARHLPEDWHRNNAALRQASHDTRTTSHNLRNESMHFRNQVSTGSHCVYYNVFFIPISICTFIYDFGIFVCVCVSECDFVLHCIYFYFILQTTNKTWWDNADNTIRLQDRIYEVQRVTDDLDRSLRQVGSFG